MKAITLLPLFIVLTATAGPKNDYAVIHTAVDHMDSPVGVDLQAFFFSWKLQSAGRNVRQSAYQILLSATADCSKGNLIWDSGKTAREQSILVPYGGRKLEPGKTYFWKVRSWSNKGKRSAWSPVNAFTPGELIFDSYAVNQKATGRPHDYTYILKGDGPETWQPEFTYYGFRYLQVNGAVPAGNPNPDNLPVILDLKMLHIRNSMPETGQFETSAQLFNRINDLIKWAIKSNVVSVATDCPHREKLG